MCGGNAVYADSDVIATARTRQKLVEHKAAIEAGTDSGPPAITPLVIPDVAIAADTTYYVGDIRVELRPVNIHSADGLVILLPADHLLPVLRRPRRSALPSLTMLRCKHRPPQACCRLGH